MEVGHHGVVGLIVVSLVMDRELDTDPVTIQSPKMGVMIVMAQIKEKKVAIHSIVSIFKL